MKSVLISIHPKWCEMIASGKKTVELKKTKPKLETPFKVYIYCTSSNIHECLMQNESGVKLIGACNYKTAIPCGGHIANGKVIGEFVCRNIDEYDPIQAHSGAIYWLDDRSFENTGIENLEDLCEYGNGKRLYGWNISNLVIYDQPKELSEFYIKRYSYGSFDKIPVPCERPPQNWYYVEEVSR